ncbi:MAG: acetyltransferase [Anaerocolumna sp.]|jgi:ribosomal protein S18 acetylase RimI-like enzyme|nr:acetyltransferase [Anaerocolumna sp.]
MGGLSLKFEEVNESNRKEVNKFLIDNWFGTDMVIRGKIIDLSEASGIIVSRDNIIGLLIYEIIDEVCEILSLDSKEENKGIGTELLARVIGIAKSRNCHKIKLITTNDNINAIKFYQKRGFDMTRIYHNALIQSRQLKPSIPLIGEFDIPLMHEIEFEMILKY